MKMQDQIKKGYLRCPLTHKILKLDDKKKSLTTDDHKRKYQLINKIPILLANQEDVKKLLLTSNMSQEYENVRINKTKKPSLAGMALSAIAGFVSDDLRTKESKLALKIFDRFNENSLCLAIGGGPKRDHPNLCNLNIAPFHNVDIVADAHNLPYVDDCVDAIHCEAVFEHLPNTKLAASEMYRVLKKGGLVYSCTPFQQVYHGYPHHYQNLTIDGHKHLFESLGFEIVESGVCVGPTFGVIIINYNYLKMLLPKPLNLICYPYLLFGLFFCKYIDLAMNKSKNAYKLASTTYVIAKKKS